MTWTSTAQHYWARVSLAGQFALAGGFVVLAATAAVGIWVSGRIEDAVVRNTANATARYMDSFVAPLAQELATHETLSDRARAELDRLLEQTSLGERVISFKIWRRDGYLVEASNAALVGQTFRLTDELALAFGGDVHADFDRLGDEEDAGEAALGLPLLEIYAPIRESGTDRVIAVAEFYEMATQLQSDLTRARVTGYAVVGAIMALMGAGLFTIVMRGSRTIDRQVLALKDLSARNVALRVNVQNAAARFSAMNDQMLRRIGADLHDGPAQLLGFAALRLDALRAQLPPGGAGAEIDAVESAVRDSIRDIRRISRGLSAPDIERRPIGEVLQGLAEQHAARTGTPVEVDIDLGGQPDLPVSVRTCAYRVAQEGLSNAWRHAEGRGQALRLWVVEDILRLAVLDRGPGLPPAGGGPREEDDEGLGLVGLADRVGSLGGHIELRTRPHWDGPGAELRMTIDLKGVA